MPSGLLSTTKEFNALLTRDPAFSKAYLAIGRGGKSRARILRCGRMPRATWTSCSTSCSSRITPCRSAFPLRTPRQFLSDFAGMFDENDTPDGFFDKMKQIASAHGYAADTKAYKADPTAYKGAVGDVSMVVRVAVAGRQNAPDLQTVMGILGRIRFWNALSKCADAL